MQIYILVRQDQLFASLGIETLDTISLVSLRTLTFVILHVLVDILDLDTSLRWTGSRNVPAVSLHTLAILLVSF